MGGGDYSPLSFIYRSPKEEDYVALWPSPTHAGARKPRHVGVGRCFDLQLGGGSRPLAPHFLRIYMQEFFNNIV